MKPEYQDGSNDAIIRDEAAHADTEEELLEDRVYEAEGRVKDLEKCIRSLVTENHRISVAVNQIAIGERTAGYMQACRHQHATIMRVAKQYGVSVPEEKK